MTEENKKESDYTVNINNNHLKALTIFFGAVTVGALCAPLYLTHQLDGVLEGTRRLESGADSIQVHIESLKQQFSQTAETLNKFYLLDSAAKAPKPKIK